MGVMITGACQKAFAEKGKLRRAEQNCTYDGTEEYNSEKCREDVSDSAIIKRNDGKFTGILILSNDRGDQVTRDYEEDVDAHKPTGETRDSGVI